MSSRAKFIVESRTHHEGDFYSVKMRPVTSQDGDGQNAAFFAATPSGEINLDLVAGPAASDFIPGKAFYVDFTEAED